MGTRDQRRSELEGLETTDPAMLVIRYYELTEASGNWPFQQREIPPAEMIEAILQKEEALCHFAISQASALPPCDTSHPSPSQ
jgi:hypothetical protein